MDEKKRPYVPAADIDGRMRAVLEAIAADTAACAALSFMEEAEKDKDQDDN